MADHSDFYNAVRSGNDALLGPAVQRLTKVCVKFLVATMDASDDLARDSVQDALESIIPKVRNDEISEPGKLHYYLLRACKNCYLRYMREHSSERLDDVSDHFLVEPGDQLSRLVDHEKQVALQQCLDGLKPPQRRFIDFWFEDSGASAEKAAKHFEMSPGAVWTRKHRVIKALGECVSKKLLN